MAVVAPDTRRREKHIAKETRPGTHYYVDADVGDDDNDGRSWATAFATVQAGDDECATGDIVHIAPGEYDETATVTGATDELTFIGEGPRTSVSIAPSTANANAFFADGTTRIEELTLININCDGNGTGVGCLVKGNIRRFSSLDCKFEAGDTTGVALKFESTAAGSIGDVYVQGGEICWAQTGLSLDISGGGDPQTEVFVDDVRFHNITANHVINATDSTVAVHLHACVHMNLEDGTGPTGLFVDLRAGTSTGTITGCYYPVALTGGKVLVDAGVVVTGCYFTGGISTGQPS